MLASIVEMVLNLDKLDNANNLKNRKPSNTLLMYHVAAYDDFAHFEPDTPQYRDLRMVGSFP